MKRIFDNFWIGFLLGLVGPVIGFLLYFLLVYLPRFSHHTIDDFINLGIYNVSAQAPLLSVCLIFNLASFFLLLKKDFSAGAKGVLYGTFTYAPVILYLKYFQ